MIGTGIGLGLSGYRLAPGKWDPSRISGLQLWLDASDSTTLLQSSGGSAAIADGDPVGYWGDKSGNGRHALQTDGTKKPVLKLGLQNSKNVVNFDGVNDWADFSAVPSENITWFIVLKLAQNKDQVLLNTPNNEAPGYAVYKAANNTYTSFGDTTFSGSANTEILGGTRGTTTGTFRKNGISGNITSPAGSTGITKLASFSTNNLFVASGYICEVIFYNSILHATDIKNVEFYLNTKWGAY